MSLIPRPPGDAPGPDDVPGYDDPGPLRALIGHRPRPDAATKPGPFGPAAAPSPEPAWTRSARPAWWSPAFAWRAVGRHPWAAGIAWLAGSAGLVWYADRAVRPSFRATTQVRVEVADPAKFTAGGPGGDFATFRQTQAKRIANPGVIDAALADRPDLITPPRDLDANAAIAQGLESQVLEGTNLVQVAMTAPGSAESARVVDAVVGAFLRIVAVEDREVAKKGQRLREARDRRAAEVATRRNEIVGLAARIGAVDVERVRNRNAVALDQYKTLSNQLLQTDLDLLAAQAKLDRVKDQAPAPAAEPDAGKIDTAVVAAFYADPQVATLRGQVEHAREQIAQTAGADRIARTGAEEVRAGARKTADEGQRQIDSLWTRRKAGLIQAAKNAAQASAAPPGTDARQAADRVAELKAMNSGLSERLGRLNEQTRTQGADELTLEFARQDLARAEAVLASLTEECERAEIDARGSAATFRQEFPARAAIVPDGGRRLAALAGGPLGLMMLIVGVMVLLERRSARVIGPDDLPANLQPRVLGILPRLPRPAATGQALDPRRRDDFARFVQSLDHLRAVLCDRRDHKSRRCLLITSAAGGEGKTMLAAQLAERCVTAGLTTLLIDADFRNPSLSRMFDRAGDRGLADVLRGEVEAEDAIGVIGDAGGFHFVPAGTDRSDPGRLLRDEALGRFLARARESFDMVLVDSPPVLPVPDALTLGRWVDAAVLSVRSDKSRFPLVEQADQKLAAMGVPVLGAVVHGVRDAGKGYGPPPGTSPIVTEARA